MANEQNLLKGNEETQFKSGREAVEAGRKGGVASGKSKRAKKSLKELAKLISENPASAREKENLAKLGIEDEEATQNAAVVSAVLEAAKKGNIQAVEKWEEFIEETDVDYKRYELPARVLGKAFVDINRRIVPNKSYVFEGGRGGLKSSFISLKIVELIKNNPIMHACVVRKVAGTLRDSVYTQMKWAINELGLTEEFDFTVSPLEITYKKTGQKIYFRGCDDPIKLKSIKAEFGHIGILWKEEKDQLSGAAEERNINQSVLRGGSESYDFSSYNPPKSKSNWVNREKLIPNENRIVHSCTYLEAPAEWLGQKFIDDAEHLKEINPEAYDHEYLGIPNGEGGNVFEYLEIRTITDKEIESFDRIYQGVDWGWYPDIFAFKRLYVDVARKKIYHIAEITGNKLKNETTAKMIIDAGFDDYAIICDSAEPKSVNDYRDAGLPARGAVKGPGSVEYGMKFLQGFTHVIDPVRTPVTYKEFTEYEYERDKDGNVISGYPDANNHTIDSTRYALEPLFNKRGNSA